MRLHKRLILFLVLILTVSGLLYPDVHVEGIPALPPVEKTTGFKDTTYGWYHVFGEVNNTGAANGSVQVTTTFTSGYGFLASVTTFTMLDIVTKTENASFHVILADSTKASQVQGRSFAVNFNQRDNTPHRLPVSQSSNSSDGDGHFHVTGSVQNLATPTKTFVQVIATFYSSTGAVAYAEWTYANPINLTAGSSGTFEIVALNTTKITKTKLVAQCNEYAVANVADFSLEILQRTQTVGQGSSVTYDIRTGPNSVLDNSALALTASGLPQGATFSFSPPSVSNASKPSKINLTITTSSQLGVGVGDFLITVTATSGASSRSVPVILTVAAAVDFGLSISPPSSSVSQGNQATYTVTAQFSGGFSSSITLNYSNIPTGSNASFDSSTLTVANPSTTFRISTNLSTTTGSRIFTVCGQSISPPRSHCATASVTVTPSTAQRFTLSIQPSERTVSPSNSTTFTVTVTSINSFNQPVQLAVTGNPAGTTATLNPTAVIPPPNDDVQSTLNISATSTPLFGTYTLTVTGSRTGFTTQTANATLIVSSFVAPDFAVYVLPTTLSVIQNNSGTATIQVVSINNFDGAVDLTLQNLPTGVTYSIANPTVAPFPGGYVNTKLTVQTSSSTTLGDHTMTLRGTSGGKTHSVTLGLLVTNQTSPLPFQCIIATATYGSEFTPEVQFLRGFRDNRVLATTSGSEFMKVFNAWYYSFSPQVAGWLAATPLARDITKLVLAPLLGILHLSEIFYTTFTFAPEIAVTFAGVVASSLIGMVYLGPILAIALRKRTGHFWSRILTPVALIWIFSALLLTAGLVISVSLVVMAATSLLVLSTLTFGSCSLPIMISKLRPIIRKHI